MAVPARASVEDVLARGHAWLRFPEAWEAQFRDETLAPRRKLLMICALVGMLIIYVGCLNNDSRMPDIAASARNVINLYLMASAIGLAVNLAMPMRWQKTWHGEALTFANAFGLNLAIIWTCTVSRADTTFTHSVTLIAAVMYACIAARLRFRWACACAVLSFAGHLIWVRGFTPQQELIVAANARLLALSFVFALVANYIFEHSERRNWLLRKLEERQRQAMEKASSHLKRLSAQDQLTGLFDRHQFDTELNLAWSEATSTGRPVAMLMLDVDFFRRYNDTYGPPAGDACLIRVANALATEARTHGGVAARLGGEEFGLLLAGRGLAEAAVIGQAVCDRVLDARIEHRASTVSEVVSVSIGVAAARPADGTSRQDLLSAAGRALYQAKEGGRNRIGADTGRQRGNTLAPDAADDDVSAEAPAMPQRMDESHAGVLQGHFRWLRFPRAMETDYQQEHALQRRRHLTVAALVGLLVYNGHVFASLPLIPDVRDAVLAAQLALSGVTLLLTLAAGMLPLGALWREAVHGACACMVALLSVWALSQGQHLLTLSYSVSLILLPLFVGIGARLPFWITLPPVLLMFAAYVLMLTPIGATQTIVFTDNVFSVGSTIVYTLIAAYTLEYGTRKQWLLAHVERSQREALDVATRRLHRLSMLDSLTGMCNRRQFEDDLQRVSEEARRENEPVAMLIIDVDFFKAYNDGYGHPAGDRCLQQVAAVLMQTAQASRGLAARLGSEEFGVLLPRCTVARAAEIGELACTAVRQAAITHRFSGVAPHVTVSVGVAGMNPGPGIDPRRLLAAADEALYRAKTSGRARVATTEP